VCVCVCVCEREREREREGPQHVGWEYMPWSQVRVWQVPWFGSSPCGMCVHECVLSGVCLSGTGWGVDVDGGCCKPGGMCAGQVRVWCVWGLQGIEYGDASVCPVVEGTWGGWGGAHCCGVLGVSRMTRRSVAPWWVDL
jgi:hypothetical protein